MDNLALMGVVLNQGQQGACTAHSEAGDREFLHNKQLAFLGQKIVPCPAGLFSPSFTYYQERVIDGTISQGDCGSTIKTSCQVGQLYGNALRSQMPYSDSDFSTAPTAVILADAKVFPTGSYHTLTTVDDVKSVIASGYNVKIGFTVYESFESDEMAQTGIWSPDPSTEQVLGGHAVLGIGYDDTVNGGSLLVRNSWGADWGKAGNFYLRYEDVANSQVVTDLFTQHLGKW
jgi:hypothetical protein